jgi:hypothetical protein
MSHDIFISYSHVDQPFVDHLVLVMKRSGVATWYDRESLRPGRKWEDVIEDAIPASRVFLTCISAAGLDKRGYFHVEQQLATRAALRVPSDQLFVIPILLGDCDIPRDFRQYHTVNLMEVGAIEMLFQSLSDALERPIAISAENAADLRSVLASHLGVEAASNEDYEKRFDQAEDLSWQDSAGLIERIANSRDSKRLAVLLRMRAKPEISYAEQAGLDIAIENVKRGVPTRNLQQAAVADERDKISRMEIAGNVMLTMQIRTNKYVRVVARKNTESYRMAEEKIRELIGLGIKELE